jgi:RNA polymerase sigma factor (sigma-70 family)
MDSIDDGTRMRAADSGDRFTNTHWSVVLLAGQANSPEAEEALAKLCRAYWYPLYVFARRQGCSPEDAQDQVQGFFAKTIEKNYLATADREKGRFRTFLLVAFKRYMTNEWHRANREKRGGGRELVSLDQDTEMRYRSEPADNASPERAFERQWALTLLERVLDRLEEEFSTPDKAAVFQELKTFLNGEKGACYSEVGARLGMTEVAVKVTVHRLRQRYRVLLREEIANTVNSPEAIEEETRNLFAALS